ncbi:hypothetical protein C8R46DRAFT_370856 [Mycena filopes]|nr:hypothetical protein C8R46DRAFT_370856 [Mycena filopes]
MSFPALPVEITSRIFGDCVIDGAEPDIQSAPLLLGRICHHWRSVALSSPELWTSFAKTIRVDRFLNIAPSRYASLSKLLQMWLARSATLPFTLSLRYEGVRIRPTLSSISSLLLQYADRWKHVTLCLPRSDLVEMFENFTGRFPLLQTLTITLPHYGSASEILPSLHFGTLQDSVHLQKLEMSLNCVRPSPSGVPWTQLVSFHGHHLQPQDAQEILRSCPSLRECDMRMRVPMNGPFMTLDLPESRFRLPELRVLHISANDPHLAVDLLAHLTLPALQRLECPLFGGEMISQVVALLSRSLCTLTHLSTLGEPGRGNIDWDDAEDYATLLTALPHLVELQLNFGIASPNLVAPLLLIPNTYLPSLTRLTICAGGTLDHELFADMLEYRMGVTANADGLAQLRSFEWTRVASLALTGNRRPSHASPAVVERVAALIQLGMEVTLDDSLGPDERIQRARFYYE